MTSVPDPIHYLDQVSIRLNNCATVAVDCGHHDVAVVMWRRAIAHDDFNSSALVGLGMLLQARGELEEAEEMAKRVLFINDNPPNVAWAWTILGRAHSMAGRRDRALVAFDKALQLEPAVPERLFDVAAEHMRQGAWLPGGWTLHTAANRGWMTLDQNYVPPVSKLWNGEKVKRLGVISLLGVGDQIMFSRFLPWAKERCDELVVLGKIFEEPIFSGLVKQGVCTFDTMIQEPLDAVIENFALPEVMGCTPAMIPRMAPTRPIAPRPGGNIKVGIVWSGSDVTATNLVRQVPFLQLLRLAENPRVHLFSFQAGDKAAAISAAHAQTLVQDFSGRIEWDWSLTAKAMSQLDLFIGPDCGPAHLAAAMGIPTFLLVSAYADWRWGKADAVASPWYPSMRLFRQKRLGIWDPVIREVQGALVDLVGAAHAEEPKKEAAE